MNQACGRNLNRRQLLKHGLYGGLAVGLSGSLWLSGCSKSRTRSRPNVVVLLIDALRPDYLNFHGYPMETAPFLAKVAAESVVFMRAFATSTCTAPSISSLFTSLYPHQHGVLEGFFATRRRAEMLKQEGKAEILLNSIPADLPTLPEIFRSMGYATFGISANINVGDEIGFSRGFDHFAQKHNAPASEVYEIIENGKEKLEKSQPYFLYLHLDDVHKPYNKRLPYYERYRHLEHKIQARYLSELGYVDAYIAKIYEILKMEKNTIFVVVSDHGEELGDHGDIGHKAKLYRELTQVVMFLRIPLFGVKPKRVDVNVSLIDVLPTLVELAGGNPLQQVKGVSLVPVLKTGKETRALTERLRNRVLFAQRTYYSPEVSHWAAIYQHWNLIEKWNSTKELFDHRRDPGEKNNVFSEHPELTSRLLAELQAFKERGLRKPGPQVGVELDQKLMEALKSLGYVE